MDDLTTEDKVFFTFFIPRQTVTFGYPRFSPHFPFPPLQWIILHDFSPRYNRQKNFISSILSSFDLETACDYRQRVMFDGKEKICGLVFDVQLKGCKKGTKNQDFKLECNWGSACWWWFLIKVMIIWNCTMHMEELAFLEQYRRHTCSGEGQLSTKVVQEEKSTEKSFCAFLFCQSPPLSRCRPQLRQ